VGIPFKINDRIGSGAGKIQGRGAEWIHIEGSREAASGVCACPVKTVTTTGNTNAVLDGLQRETPSLPHWSLSVSEPYFTCKETTSQRDLGLRSPSRGSDGK
jgi:hypothetical protein